MFGSILQAARKSLGLSQVELALRGKTYQANISEFENELTSPSLETANELFAALGYKLIAVPFLAPTVAEWSVRINETLKNGNEKRAFRLFIQVNDQLTKVEPELLSTLCLTPPFIQNKQYKALITGLVQYHLKRNRLPLPAWANSTNQRLSAPWFVDNNSRLEEFVRKNTPTEFSRLNVFLSEDELRSA